VGILQVVSYRTSAYGWRRQPKPEGNRAAGRRSLNSRKVKSFSFNPTSSSAAAQVKLPRGFGDELRRRNALAWADLADLGSRRVPTGRLA